MPTFPTMEPENVTHLLRRAEAGDPTAANELYAAVYGELRRRAEALMSGHPDAPTLQPTAVVHEAWLRMCAPRQRGSEWRERGHFLAVASKAMRSVLVDHARRRNAERRGGSSRKLEWDDALVAFEDRAFDLMALDEALERLGALDPELARLVELRFFGGLSIADASAALEKSTATIERAWRTARTWLRAELGEAEAPEDRPPANGEDADGL